MQYRVAVVSGAGVAIIGAPLDLGAGRRGVDSLEVVEVNPIRDHENTTAALAVELVASALGVRIL